ncbi:hypothetical protein AB0M97_24190 [Streptomyces sp. NPDC051207]|uniref:hypothetical protein n=1 Tax=Streptomyces sp. NPDC051207 TaxID=3154641 RepID=UPI00341B1F01
MGETGASPPRTPPAHSPLARAERFLWLTARVLERHLFAYHFREGAAGRSAGARGRRSPRERAPW